MLDGNGAWEAVLENAYDIIVTGEINGEDTLSFKIPYRDGKRGYIDSEKKIQIVDDVYKVRTVTDTRDTDGSAVTEVYAEAEFYDLTFSVRKEERTFEAEYPETAMAYAGQSAPGPVRKRMPCPSSEIQQTSTAATWFLTAPTVWCIC